MSSSIDKLRQLGALDSSYTPSPLTDQELEQSERSSELSSSAQKLQALGALAPIPKPRSQLKPIVTQEEPGMLDEIALGVKESMLPFSLTEEEAKKTPTITRSLTNIASDIGQSMAAAAVGGLVAGPVGAVIAGVGAGVYRAVGLESVKAQAEDRAIDPKKAAVNLTTELLPVVKTGKVLTRAVASAAQGAAQFEQAKQYGASGEMAALVGVLGGSLTYAARGVTDKLPTVSKNDVETVGAGALVTQGLPKTGAVQSGVATSLSDAKASANLKEAYLTYLEKNKDAENALVDALTKAAEQNKVIKSPSSIDKTLLDQIAKHEAIPEIKERILQAPALKNWVTRNQANLDHYAASILVREAQAKIKLDPEEIAKQATSLKEVIIGQRAAAIMTDEFTKVAADLADPLIGKGFFSKVGADYFVARAIDDVTGLGLRSTMDSLALSEMSHRTTVLHWDRKITELVEPLRKLKVDKKDLGIALEMDEAAKLQFLSAKYKPAQVNELVPILDKIRKQFDEIRAFAVNNGVSIAYRENYVTSMAQEASEIAKNFNIAFQLTAKNFNLTAKVDDVAKQISADSTETFTQLVKASTYILDRKPETLQDIQRAYKTLRSPEFLKKQIGFELSAAFSRKGEIPELIRERDIETVLKAYARNVSRAVHLTPQIEILNNMKSVLHAGGFNKSTQWLSQYIRSVSGEPGVVDASIAVMQNRAKISLAELTKDDPMLKKIGVHAQDFFLNTVTRAPRNMYAAFLGGDLGPAVTNMTQTFFMTIPELGGKLGTRYVSKALIQTAKDMTSFSNIEQKVMSYLDSSSLPPEFARRWKNKAVMPDGTSIKDSTIQLDSFREGVAKSGVYEAIKKTTNVTGDIINNVGMYVYSKTDSVNRLITINTARSLAAEYLAGKAGARKFVAKADKSLQADLSEIQKFGGTAEQKAKLTEYVMSTYLIGKTQFYYTKSQSFALGREWGAVVTQFTKFPVMIGSDIAEGFYRGGAVGGVKNITTKYIMPLLVADQIRRLMSDYTDNERAKVLRLNSALRSSPITSVTDLNPPPMVAAATKTFKAFTTALEQDIETGARTIGKAVSKEVLPAALPGMWIPKSIQRTYRFVTNEPFPED